MNTPHRRYNPLLDTWVLVSPHRTQRPWQGAEEPIGSSSVAYDENCYLCPGNVRASGSRNPEYESVYVFQNDFAALLMERGKVESEDSNLFRKQGVAGECRVICYSPRHDLTMAQMAVDEIETVISVWQKEYAELSERWRWVQIFENKGEVMGCSNPHPHGQIWAGDWVPDLVHREREAQRQYSQKHGRSLLMDVANEESKSGERVVEENEDWLVIVPFWATWPFETLVLPKFFCSKMTDFDAPERRSLAQILKTLLSRYDRLFGTSFPYSMGWHGQPGTEVDNSGWQFHGHFFPPLLRSSTVKKFMVGYEMLAESQRDLSPEQAAQMLREA